MERPTPSSAAPGSSSREPVRPLLLHTLVFFALVALPTMLFDLVYWQAPLPWSLPLVNAISDSYEARRLLQQRPE